MIFASLIQYVCAFSNCLPYIRPNVWCWGDVGELDATAAHKDLTVQLGRQNSGRHLQNKRTDFMTELGLVLWNLQEVCLTLTWASQK